MCITWVSNLVIWGEGGFRDLQAFKGFVELFDPFRLRSNLRISERY